MDATEFPYKICIPYQDHPRGGMYTFFNYFTQYLSRNKIPYTRRLLSRYDFLLVNSFMTNPGKVWFAGKVFPRARVVQRVDGAAQDYGRANGGKWDALQGKVSRLADLTVYQSDYGKYATTRKFPVIASDGPVIYNPVDTELFKSSGAHGNPGKTPRVAYVSFSTHPNKGAGEFFALARANPDLDFVFAGRTDNPPRLPNVKIHGHCGRAGIAEILRGCHFFAFFSRNEACPNVVLEAMASGLPVLYLDSGATGELVGDTGRAITVETFRENLNEIFKAWPEWSARARQRAVEFFTVERAITQYLRAMLGLVGK